MELMKKNKNIKPNKSGSSTRKSVSSNLYVMKKIAPPLDEPGPLVDFIHNNIIVKRQSPFLQWSKSMYNSDPQG